MVASKIYIILSYPKLVTNQSSFVLHAVHTFLSCFLSFARPLYGEIHRESKKQQDAINSCPRLRRISIIDRL